MSAILVTFYYVTDYSQLTEASKSLLHQLPNNSPNPIYNPSCFNEGTKILCLNQNGEEEWKAVETLRGGDLVKTYLHGYRKIDLIGKGYGKNVKPNSINNIYRQKNPTLEEPLLITGWHGILVDDLGEYKEANDIYFGNETPKIDNKYLLLSYISNDFEEMEQGYRFTYYHFVLENSGDNDQRFGVWANGVLVETTSKNLFLNSSYILI